MSNLYYLCQPSARQVADPSVTFVDVSTFLADESSCLCFWQLIDSQFKTRSKFLAIWRCVSFVAVHRTAEGLADGFLLVSAPVNWQIDYVVVHPDSRGQGIASKLVTQTIRIAAERAIPYVMLTSSPNLRTMYESCGFQVVAESRS